MRTVGASLHPWGLTGCRYASERGEPTGRSATPSRRTHWPAYHPINDTREASQLSDPSPHRGAPQCRVVGAASAVAPGTRPWVKCCRHAQQASRPVVPSRDVDPVAAAVIEAALKVRASHLAVPTMDILDLVLQGRRTRPLNFGAIWPASPFGLLVVEAFDRGTPERLDRVLPVPEPSRDRRARRHLA